MSNGSNRWNLATDHMYSVIDVVKQSGVPSHGASLLYLSRGDLENLEVDFAEVLTLVEHLFREHAAGRVVSPPKRGLAPIPGASIRSMKAHVPALAACGIKWISAYPENTGAGLPTISGLVILNDIATGLPTAVLDCAWITAVRTAASTALAARLLARPDSASIGIVACGVQGRVNLAALARELPLKRCRAYDIDPVRAAQFSEQMSERLGLSVEPVLEPEAAVAGMDVVVTTLPIKKVPSPLFGRGLLAAGSLACLLDFDAAFDPIALAEVDRIVVDDADQLDFLRTEGYFQQTPEPAASLAGVLVGQNDGRRDDRERIIAMNLGIGMLDIGLACWLVAQARKLGVGSTLPL